MIKFFRRIRQNLIETGKTSKYLKYAIGEIILVVIGILIALQINNWNDKRKSVNRSTAYLKEILEDLRADSTELAIKISWVAEELEQIEWYLSNDNTNFNTTNLDSLKLAAYAPYPDFYIHDATYKKILNSGDAKLLGFEMLSKKINKYYNQINNRVKKNNDFLIRKVGQWENKLAQLFEGIEIYLKIDARLNNPNLKEQNWQPQHIKNEKSLLAFKSIALKQHLRDQYNAFDFLLYTFKQVKAETNDLIVQINDELQKN